MPNEWKYATFNWDPVVDTSATLAAKLEALLLASGWELAPYSTDFTKCYIRTDRDTQDTWHYIGSGVLKHCGIRIWDREGQLGSPQASGALRINSYVENEFGTAVESTTGDPRDTIYWNPNRSEVSNVVAIAGESGLYVEMGPISGRGTSMLGAVMTFMPWATMWGTRDNQRKLVSQGLVLDMLSTSARLKACENSDWRFVCNDGFNSNKSTHISCFAARGVASVRSPGTDYATHRVRLYVFENMFVPLTGSSMTDGRPVFSTLGLFDTPFDDKWNIGKLIALQASEDGTDTLVNSTSTLNTLAPATTTQRGWRINPRHLLREVPKFCVLSHLLTPWQLIEDSVTGAFYRVIRIEDNGRPVCMGVEWPGIANEVVV